MLAPVELGGGEVAVAAGRIDAVIDRVVDHPGPDHTANWVCG